MLLFLLVFSLLFVCGCAGLKDNNKPINDSSSATENTYLETLLKDFPDKKANRIKSIISIISNYDNGNLHYVDDIANNLNCNKIERIDLSGSTGAKLILNDGIEVEIFGKPAYTICIVCDEKTISWDVINNEFYDATDG